MNSFHNRIIARVDMVNLVSEHSVLTQHGPDDYWGPCPLHVTSSPTLHVRASRPLFKCFTCGRGGDPFRWVEAVEGKSFAQAVRILAKRTGLSEGED